MARILIVEDDAENRSLMLTMITMLGHEAHAVPDGVRALTALGVDPGELADHPDFSVANLETADDPPDPAPGAWDLVFLDILLPGPDGCEVCRRLRGAGLEMPVVAVTGLAMTGDRETCLDAGMNDYVPKPYTVDGIAEMLENWL